MLTNNWRKGGKIKTINKFGRGDQRQPKWLNPIA